jgi:putative SOS response-associated peptidase YedK
MCGRFTLRTPSNLLIRQFMLDAAPELPLRYNIAPTQNVAVIRRTPEDPQRQLVLLRWGLIPSWAKDAKIGSTLINARADTVADKPSFRAAFKRRRCLVLADGYYEWQKTAAATPAAKSGGKSAKKAPPKQPYYIHMQEGKPFAFAGLWEWWEGTPEQPGPIETCTIVTTDANELTRPIHDRMPVILPESAYDLWLDPQVQKKEPLLPLLQPFPSDSMQTEAISTHVNSVRNDDAACIEPVEADEQRTLF